MASQIDNKTVSNKESDGIVNQEAYDDIMKEALNERREIDHISNPVAALGPVKHSAKKNKSSSLNIKKLYNLLAVLIVIQIATYLSFEQKNELASIEAKNELSKTFATNSTILEGLNELSDPSVQFSGPNDLRMQQAIDTLNKSFTDTINYEPIDINEFYFFDNGESIYVSKSAMPHKSN